jgi:hypothetical protein
LKSQSIIRSRSFVRLSIVCTHPFSRSPILEDVSWGGNRLHVELNLDCSLVSPSGSVFKKIVDFIPLKPSSENIVIFMSVEFSSITRAKEALKPRQEFF